ncbi:hypothetical protein OHT57_30875 [Streptomyces sp. NBC_00285]|uniref:hypothetical protein n=1 Tax=Streptomyces sp. NBC_00285 TaxID=2975700 RepID=UPI002E292062|nr:hypothetical protein [Streptomyces sp. NBC_00285]
MLSLLNPVVGLLMLRGIVTDTEPAGERRVHIEGDTLAGPDVRPGQQVRSPTRRRTPCGATPLPAASSCLRHSTPGRRAAGRCVVPPGPRARTHSLP